MITKEQYIKVANILKNRNLPLDIETEISDHMCEQIEHKISIEDKNFDTALEETLQSWSQELKPKYSFWELKSITKFHRDILNKSNKVFLIRSLKYFSVLFFVAIILLFTNKNYASVFIFWINIIAVFVGVFVFLSDYRLMKTAFVKDSSERKISYLQGGTMLLWVSVLAILSNIIFRYTERFGKLYHSFLELQNHNFALVNILPFVYMFVFVFASIYGLLHYLEYRKSIKNLKQKLKFNF